MEHDDNNSTQVEELSSATAMALASLIGIGCQSGDVVMGLSSVRRVRGLAFVFVDAGIAPGTLAEMERLQRAGTRVYRVAPLSQMTGSAGRYDVFIMGVKSGSLADGVRARIATGSGGSVQANDRH